MIEELLHAPIETRLAALGHGAQVLQLLGLAQRDYDRVVRQTADGFGLSQSTISRRCVEEATRALREFESRDLSGEPYVALWLDGKQVRGTQVVICVGATASGYKQVLGFTCASTEDGRSVKALLRGLIERGLDFSGGLVVTTDGSKGLQSAVDATFGRYAVRQRCHWHGARERRKPAAEGRAVGMARAAA